RPAPACAVALWSVAVDNSNAVKGSSLPFTTWTALVPGSGRGRGDGALPAETARACAAHARPPQPDHLLRLPAAPRPAVQGELRPVRIGKRGERAEPHARRRPPAAQPVLDLGIGHCPR